MDLFETSVVEFLFSVSGCSYISDMPKAGALGRYRMAHLLRGLSAQRFSLASWNDALDYLAGHPPVEAVDEARELLIEALEPEPKRT